MTEVEDVPAILLPCATCGRTFRPEALSKHTAVCERHHVNKRKKFDSAKQRIQGTDLAEFLGPPPLTNKPKPPSPKKMQSKWKEKQPCLKKSVREEASKLGEHQQCPYCERCFGPKAFDRHVAWCKEQHAKIHNNSLREDISKAKERLEARIKYRAPHFKSQRSVTKEKYASGRHHSTTGSLAGLGMSNSATFPVSSVDPKDRIRTSSMSSSTTELGLNEHSSRYSSVNVQRSVASTMPSLTRRGSLQRSTGRNDVSNKYQKKKPEESSVTSTPVLTRKARTGSISSQGSVEGRSTASSNYSVSGERHTMSGPHLHTGDTVPTIKTSHSTNRDLERYDPFVSAELQMLELLKSEDDEEAKHPRDSCARSSSIGGSIVDALPSDKVVSLASSERVTPVADKPQSASKGGLSKVRTRAQSACSESEVVSKTSVATRRDSVGGKRAQSSGGSKKTEVDSSEKGEKRMACVERRMSVDSETKQQSTVGGVEEILSPVLQTSSESAFSPLPEILTRNSPKPDNNDEFKMLSLSTLSLCSEGSLEALEPNLRTRCGSAAPRQTKQRLNMHDLLFGLDNTNEDSKDSFNNMKAKRRDVDRCEAQLLRSMVEFELLLNRDNDSPSPPPPPTTNHITDSAYSSLNRRWSPVDDRLATAGSERDVPAPSKFCHECGGRYPVPGAKFCCICGVRRLAI